MKRPSPAVLSATFLSKNWTFETVGTTLSPPGCQAAKDAAGDKGMIVKALPSYLRAHAVVAPGAYRTDPIVGKKTV